MITQILVLRMGLNLLPKYNVDKWAYKLLLHSPIMLPLLLKIVFRIATDNQYCIRNKKICRCSPLPNYYKIAWSLLLFTCTRWGTLPQQLELWAYVEGQTAGVLLLLGCIRYSIWFLFTLYRKHLWFDPFTINTLSITQTPHFREKYKEVWIVACSLRAWTQSTLQKSSASTQAMIERHCRVLP